AGAGDNAAGALGVGVTEPGQAFISLGTSGVFFVVSDSHRASPENTVHAFCHCLPQRWHQMSVSLSAANSLAWFASLMQIPVDDLLAELETSGITKTPVQFLPYLSGERTPHNDPKATGCFFGMTSHTKRPHLTLAVLEGVAYSFADGLAALDAAGSYVQDITLIGGGARSALWRQLLADVLNRQLTFRDGGEIGPALGAARLAMLGYLIDAGDKFDSQLLASVCPIPALVAKHVPNADRHAYSRHQLEKYRALYQCTRALNTNN
ncbi:MAG: FGGY-family carbohydrate kinase, partial [Pseudomonadales bacterium]